MNNNQQKHPSQDFSFWNYWTDFETIILICLNKYMTNLKISAWYKKLFKKSSIKKEQTLLLEMENTMAKFKNSVD